MESETVQATVFTAIAEYDVYIPADLDDQLRNSLDVGWVSLAFVRSDNFICLRAKDITGFKREFTAAEKQRRHTLKGPPLVDIAESLRIDNIDSSNAEKQARRHT